MADKTLGQNDPAIAAYVNDLFRPEDAALAEIRARAAAENLPEIHVSPYDGRILEVIARAVGARKVVEIGTLAGYSTLCLFRGLQAGGTIWTCEFDAHHADVAQESFSRNAMSGQVNLLRGAALDNLPSIEQHGPFDLVFIDADKTNYPAYLQWAARQLRIGGTVLLDNTFAWGQLADPANTEPDTTAFRQINQELAANTHFRGVIIPTGEGLSMGVKIG